MLHNQRIKILVRVSVELKGVNSLITDERRVEQEQNKISNPHYSSVIGVGDGDVLEIYNEETETKIQVPEVELSEPNNHATADKAFGEV